MILSEYDVGDNGSHAVARRKIAGEPRVILSAWEDVDMANLSCVGLFPDDARSLAGALMRAANGEMPEFPDRAIPFEPKPWQERFVILWTDETGDQAHTLVYHELPEDHPAYNDPKFTPARIYERGDLRENDTIVTTREEAILAIGKSDADHPLAIPVEIAKEMGWIPGGFD